MDYDEKSTHYGIGGIETIEIIKAKLTPAEYRGYLKGNVLKYACRLGHKGDPVRDVEKLRYYTEWLKEATPGGLPTKRFKEPAEPPGRFEVYE